MKPLRAIFLSFGLVASLLPAFTASPAQAACSCVCIPTSTTFTSGGGPGSPPSTSSNNNCSGAEATLTLPDQPDTASCIKACAAQTPKSGSLNMPCYESNGAGTCESQVKKDCWCTTQDKTSQFMGQTSSLSDCQQTCADAKPKLEFGNWDAPPATKTSMIKCPPGGMWTREECQAQVDTMGEKIGEWLPPTQSDTKGPYCFVLQKPVKLSIALGGVSSADLAQYISAAYRLGMGVAAVLAVIFIMIGGFRYITAAGGGGIEGAKDMIKNAVMGLVLTALSYTLLQTVNPDITGLRLPRVQMVKTCNIGVSCGAREDKETCEKNIAASGMRCIWDINRSSCYDNSVNEAGALGSNGGDCQNDGQGNFSCLDGSKCIAIDSVTHRCSQGKACQACNADNDCASQNGAPGKCQDHVCVVPDPKGQIGSYLKCDNASCSEDKQCNGGFCDKAAHTCRPAGQGKDCTAYGQESCASGYKCLEFQAHSGSGFGTAKFCCLDGDPNACRGCGTDASCPDNMVCNISDKDPKTQYKCVTK